MYKPTDFHINQRSIIDEVNFFSNHIRENHIREIYLIRSKYETSFRPSMMKIYVSNLTSTCIQVKIDSGASKIAKS